MEGLWLEGRVSGEEGGEIGCKWCHDGMGVFGRGRFVGEAEARGLGTLEQLLQLRS